MKIMDTIGFVENVDKEVRLYLYQDFITNR